MRHGFKEDDFQRGVFLPFLTGHGQDQLGWVLGKPSDIDSDRWLIPGDILEFIRDGNPSNQAAFEKAAQAFASDEDCAKAFIEEALAPRIAATPNASFVLREPIVFRSYSFSLWNEAPRAGAQQAAADFFARNLLRAVPEAAFERVFPLTGKRIKRRPDCVFFVNGVYFAYSELKTAQTGQTAATDGRKKIAHNCVESAIAVLAEAREDWARAGGKWPGFRSRSMPAAERNRIRHEVCLYEKAVHISCVDMGNLMLLQDLEWLLADVDEAIEKGDRIGLEAVIPQRLIAAFTRGADMREKSPSEALADHLAALFSAGDGIDREIFYFNQSRPSRTTTGAEILLPRPAQRAMLFQTIRRVRELYAEEGRPKISEQTVRERLAIDLPDLDSAKADQIVSETLLYRNGAESHSVLLQGAAGLGKTNVIVWLAQALADMPDPRSKTFAPLFDLCVLLTDRTELRKNVAEEAGRLRATREIVAEARTFKQLRLALIGRTRVVVVNVHKFPSLQRLAGEDPELAELLLRMRVAFVIDEVHRSQSGVLHNAMIDVFDQWGTIRPEGAKRNLVIGLTATPTDEILARIGEWRSPSSPGDDIRWAPYFAYTMTQAIRDKVILNPIQNVVRFEDHVVYAITDTLSKIGEGDKLRAPTADEIYENPNRQRFVARKAARVFAAKTMMAVRPAGGRTLGEGKALFASNSIRSAIAYQTLLKEELEALAADSRFSEHAETLRNIPVLLLYTDKQGEASCSSKNDGRNQEQIIDAFRRKGIESAGGLKVRNSIVVVVDKLLTGFDEPTLHTVFIDRGMDDVLLFQTACRANRLRKWKSDCLIVDFSHAGIVSKNLPKVFAKYGGIAVSDLDAMDLVEKMNAAYCGFFKDRDVETHWRTWRATLSGGKDSLGAMGLSDFLDELVLRDIVRAAKLRKYGTAWLSSRTRLLGILDFDRAELRRHNDEWRVAFAEQVVNHLSAKTKDADERVGAVFDIDLVEESEGWGLDEIPESKKRNRAKELASKNGLPQSVAAIAESLDALELLVALQLTEEQKLELIEKLKDFLRTLFAAMDAVGKRKNNDVHRKLIQAMAANGEDYSWENRFGKFKELLDAAVIEPNVFAHPHRKAFLNPLMRRPELVMADYEEWVVVGDGRLRQS
ncbi:MULTISPECIES: type I restriction enzyme subunit R domain-containing protein [unclassified Burkholderia]|uniref:type I restriction enzyme subunit R domain-containing protein n=1 Tax=unclassified Burkholderia TaxID=2613784 RepID=UPI002ABDE01B|nr:MULTISPECIES: DEAD/DEAH box helicase family protein [unclassified Burkholderia]